MRNSSKMQTEGPKITIKCTNEDTEWTGIAKTHCTFKIG